MRTRVATLVLLGTCVATVYGVASSKPAAAAQDAAFEAATTRELDADQQVAHALSRLTFGARPGDAARVRAMGVDKWIDLQLHSDRIDDAATTQFLSRYETLGMTSAQLYREFPPANAVRAAARRDSLQRAGGVTRSDTVQLVQQARRNNMFVAELTSSRVAAVRHRAPTL
jgi:hypothetical protein